MGTYRLEELNASNIVAANSLTLKRGQEQFIAPPSYAISEAYVNPTTAWPRVVMDGETVVGFIRGNFDPDNASEELRSCLWRIHVAADYQGKGVGKFAVAALADEARSRGNKRLTVLWEKGVEGPEAFFLRVGFKEVGTTAYGEVIGEITL
ncbi:GNAT family N-acetyltransferase [Aurantimicrobium minutum]|jgi:diamine N-acetyltransferase|uniref:GNAT family N-acetyltransferase n=1 Tax=Aurantimicrobium minutum TaxID=708131 RepID=UPI002473C630|nr:GNAT family N-acetyltransferase [Aurantimicrobium minutum]MDH6424093.1 diamine N-acetyltransferase [Aurantimicrobium minutum]MDH6537211.1 diamine N-acetyltransferase [Aurantimicrobium minutum]